MLEKFWNNENDWKSASGFQLFHAGKHRPFLPMPMGGVGSGCKNWIWNREKNAKNQKGQFFARKKQAKVLHPNQFAGAHRLRTHFILHAKCCSTAPATWRKNDSHVQAMMTVFGTCLQGMLGLGYWCDASREETETCLHRIETSQVTSRAGRFTRWYSTYIQGPGSKLYDPANRNQALAFCSLRPPLQIQWNYVDASSPKRMKSPLRWAGNLGPSEYDDPAWLS